MVDKEKYIPWYRIAEDVLGPLVPKRFDDNAVMEWVSQSDWLIIPTPTEADLSAAKNRPDANIYFGLNGEIDLGLVCNTLASIWKMENILLHYYEAERDKFMAVLNRLDDDFHTEVGRKTYEHYWAQSPSHTVDISYKSNSMTETKFRRLFSKGP